jgi:alginate O-acetyltransferase complex protein AlgI
MVFSSFQFLLFFVVVLLGVLALPAGVRELPLGRQKTLHPRKLWLLAASYVFYASWDFRFPILLLVSTVVNFWAGKAIHRTQGSGRRKQLLWASTIVNLGLLGFFKYYNFFVNSVSSALLRWGPDIMAVGISPLDILLPVGISFYTFQNISYVVDIYRNKQEPADSLSDFGLFIAFFPKLVAGPIVRAAGFLPQLKRPVRVTGANVWAGSQIFIVGLFKKLMIADAVAPFVNTVYASPEYYSSSTIWLVAVAYALQVYCDFSGYSDMAIGCARILGFRLDRNFYMPYLSRNAQEFWRRWHITLSNWLRDYLYIPLGGSRKGRFRTYLNVVITMLLGGLWHGASWNFVIWGGVHGLALAIHRWWSGLPALQARDARATSRRAKPAKAISQILSTVVTFIFVTLTWVLFRAPDVDTMAAVYSKLLFINPVGAQWYYHAAFTAMGWVILGHIVGILRANKRRPQAEELIFFKTPYSYVAAFFVVLTLLIIYVFAPTNVSPFIYFQF